MKKSSLKQLVQWIPGLLISAIAIYILLRYIKIEDLLHAIREFTIEKILIIIVLIFIPLGFRALAWKSLLQDISFEESFLMINEGYFLNNLIPRSGEIARIFLAKSVSNISGFHTAASILFERGLDVIIAAGLFLSTISFVVDLNWLQPIALILIFIFLCILLGILILSANAIKVIFWLEDQKFKFSLFEKKIKPLLFRGLNGLAGFAKPQNLISSFFWILCSWVFWVGLLVYALKLIIPDAPVWWAIFAEGVLALGIALPSAPASLGVYEGTMVIAFSILGIDKTSALSTAIILHTIQIIITSLIGIVGLSKQGFTLVEVLKNITNRLRKKTIVKQDFDE